MRASFDGTVGFTIGDTFGSQIVSIDDFPRDPTELTFEFCCFPAGGDASPMQWEEASVVEGSISARVDPSSGLSYYKMALDIPHSGMADVAEPGLYYLRLRVNEDDAIWNFVGAYSLMTHFYLPVSNPEP